MNTKTVAIVVAGAAILAAAALVVSRSGRDGAAQTPSGPMFPALVDRADSVASLVVESSSGRATIQRAGSNWTLSEKGGYPVKADRVREVVVGLSQLRSIEPKTSRPDRYAEIGVEDPPSPDMAASEAPTKPPAAPRGARVTLRDPSGATILSVLVGTQRMGNPPATFVRTAGEATSWLAEGQVDVPKDLLGWVDTQIVNLVRDRVRSATITPGRADGGSLVIGRERREDTNFTIQDLPPGKAPKNAWDVDQPATVFSWLNFEDVRPAAEIANQSDSAESSSYRVETFDGLVIEATVFQADGRRWATIEASSLDVPEAATTAQGSDAPGGEADKARDARTEARLLNDRHAGWAYLIPEHKALSMIARLDSLVIEAPERAHDGPAGPMDPSGEVREEAPGSDETDGMGTPEVGEG